MTVNKVKYITFVSEFGCDDIIVFSFIQKHSHIASVMQMNKEDILGAGFIDIDVNDLPYGRRGVTATCWGESTSLTVSSRGKEDSDIADTMLNLDG